MADSVTSIPKTFVVVSPNQPASPFEGQLWRDTSKDVLKQWDGTTWVSVQSSLDGTSVTQDANGNTQVGEGIVVRDLANVDEYIVDGYQFSGNNTVVDITGSGYLHKCYLRVINNDTSEGYIEITVDGNTQQFRGIRNTSTTGSNHQRFWTDLPNNIRFENDLKVVFKTDSGEYQAGRAFVVMD